MATTTIEVPKDVWTQIAAGPIQMRFAGTRPFYYATSAIEPDGRIVGFPVREDAAQSAAVPADEFLFIRSEIQDFKATYDTDLSLGGEGGGGVPISASEVRAIIAEAIGPNAVAYVDEDGILGGLPVSEASTATVADLIEGAVGVDVTTDALLAARVFQPVVPVANVATYLWATDTPGEENRALNAQTTHDASLAIAFQTVPAALVGQALFGTWKVENTDDAAITLSITDGGTGLAQAGWEASILANPTLAAGATGYLDWRLFDEEGDGGAPFIVVTISRRPA